MLNTCNRLLTHSVTLDSIRNSTYGYMCEHISVFMCVHVCISACVHLPVCVWLSAIQMSVCSPALLIHSLTHTFIQLLNTYFPVFFCLPYCVTVKLQAAALFLVICACLLSCWLKIEVSCWVEKLSASASKSGGPKLFSSWLRGLLSLLGCCGFPQPLQTNPNIEVPY